MVRPLRYINEAAEGGRELHYYYHSIITAITAACFCGALLRPLALTPKALEKRLHGFVNILVLY